MSHGMLNDEPVGPFNMTTDEESDSCVSGLALEAQETDRQRRRATVLRKLRAATALLAGGPMKEPDGGHRHPKGGGWVDDTARVDETATVVGSVRGGAIVGPCSFVSEGAVVGESSVVGMGVVVGKWATVGNHVKIDDKANVGNHVRLGDCTAIGESVVIGEGATLGTHCFVRVGSTIGRRACIGDAVHLEYKTFVGNYAKVGEGATLYGGAAVLDWSEVGQWASVGAQVRVMVGARVEEFHYIDDRVVVEAVLPPVVEPTGGQSVADRELAAIVSEGAVPYVSDAELASMVREGEPASPKFDLSMVMLPGGASEAARRGAASRPRLLAGDLPLDYYED